MGKIVSFEGIDGSGKTTALAIFKELLCDLGVETLMIAEPGGTPVGDLVRKLTSSVEASHHPWVDALMFMAARIDNIHSLIIPALSSGKWVLLDRFVDSTFAYQGYGQGLELNYLERIYRYAGDNLFPDRTILMDCPVDTAWKRITERGLKKDRWEKLGFEFFERVRHGYIELARKYSNRFVVINSNKSLDEIRFILKREISLLRNCE